VGGKPWKIRTRSRGLQQQQITVRGYRPREYLTEREIGRLMEAARVNRYGHRDATAILLGLSPRLRARIRRRVRRGKKQGGSGEPPCCCVGERPQACSCDSCCSWRCFPFVGINTPSLPAQGEQRRPSLFNIRRDIPGAGVPRNPHVCRVNEGRGVVLPRITSAWISRSGNHRPNNLRKL
jgi:hypothetical protein